MPAANELISVTDAPPEEPALIDPSPGDDAWGFAAASAAKKKKKSKKKNASPPKEVVPKEIKAEEIDDAFAPTIAPPSPPVEVAEVVEVPVPEPVPVPVERPLSPPPLLVEDIPNEEVDLVPEPPPERRSSLRPVTLPSPRLRSAQPVLARPPNATVSPVPPPARAPALQSPRERPRSISGQRQIPGAAPGLSPQVQPRHDVFPASTSPRPKFTDPPPPHLPQAHFWGLPDLGLNLKPAQETSRPAGSDGYCCCLDSFSDAGDEASAKKARDAILVGSEGGLEVFRVLSNKLEVVGRLEGLRGSVIGAKILPHTSKFDPLHHLRPLVALIVHGPTARDRRHSGPVEIVDAAEKYQTSVEVYSLQSQQHVATLYKSIAVEVNASFGRQNSALPEPIGDLTIAAEGSFVTVASGKSGEVFVFATTSHSNMSDSPFRCIGKFWTSLQVPIASGARPSGGAEADAGNHEPQDSPRRPIYSLSARWLAIVPPFLSSAISVSGTPLLADYNASPPGLATHVAPAQPLITCEVVGTDVEGTWSRLGRQAAQSLVKYSQKGIEMSWQGWKELTNPSNPNRQMHERSPSKEDMFPPTKGPSDDPSRRAKEPALVSIIDLESLIEWEDVKPKHLPAPMATFALIEGCSFVSFSLSGVKLLSASRKGEVSTVWDLTQAAHGVAKHHSISSDESENGPCIKQLHRITRNSPSTILECAWTLDDDALALLTSHGTVHLHEVPLFVSHKKRKRRTGSVSVPNPEKADATVSLTAAGSPPSSNQGFISSIKSGWQSVSTQVNSIRSTNATSAFGLPTTFAGFREVTAAAGNIGSRAVARGLSQGYTAAKGGASDYWHADDNKIRLKTAPELNVSRTVRWVRRQNTSSIVIVSGGAVHVHPVQRVTRRKGDEIVSGLKHEKYSRKAFTLAPIATRAEPGTRSASSIRPDSCAAQGPHGFWSLRQSTPPAITHAHAQAQQQRKYLHDTANDVETNPPYCPFHVDPRVNIFAYDENEGVEHYGGSTNVTSFSVFLACGSGGSDGKPWVFGNPLPRTVRMNERLVDEEDDDPGSFELRGGRVSDEDEDEDGDPDAFASQVESRLTIQSGTRGGDGRQPVEDEIRINTRLRTPMRHGNKGGMAAVKGSPAKGRRRAGGDVDHHRDEEEGMADLM